MENSAAGYPPRLEMSRGEILNCELNIPKGLSTEIRVVLADSQEICGQFFLADFARDHYGEETLLELLNQAGKEFIPFEQSENGAVVLVGKSQIIALKPEFANSAKWFECSDQDTDSWPSAKIVFSGFSLEGRLYTGDMQPQRRRITDLLNHQNNFFVFETEEGPWIINKILMKYLEPLS